MKYIAGFLLLVYVGTSACTSVKNSFWNSPEAYLEQRPPNDTPRVFAAGRLTDTGIALDRVAFSPDGKEFYYCTADKWFDSKGAKVRYFHYAGGRWEGPLVLNEGPYAPTFSMDGNALYFQGKGGIWQSKRTDTGWGAPAPFMTAAYGLYGFMPTRSGTYYIGSNARGGNVKDFSTYDFCTLQINGLDTVVRSLGAPLNTPGFDGDFFIAPDESYMVLSANETKEYQSELHISFRKKDRSWTTPKSLSALINNGLAHRWGQYVTPDGRYLFYTQGTSEKDCHIYWMRFDKLLKQLKKRS